MVGGVVVKQSEIPTLLATEIPALEFFGRYRMLGLPFSGGWAEQPAVVVDLIETLAGVEAQVAAEAHGNAR